MSTLSFLFCFGILELHYSLAATHEQKQVFYHNFHQILAIWLLGLWIGIQKLPEVFLPNTNFVHKFISSDIIKSSIVIFSLLTIHYLIRDALKLTEAPAPHNIVTIAQPVLQQIIAPAHPAPHPLVHKNPEI